jgi:putative transposase
MGYPTDLSDGQWAIIKPRLDEMTGNYRHSIRNDYRQYMNAILYVTKTGCQWDMLPNDFPKYTAVKSFFRRLRIRGLWEVINADIVEIARVSVGRNPVPSYGLIDSQSTKTTGAADERGIDGGKKQKGANGISSQM